MVYHLLKILGVLNHGVKSCVIWFSVDSERYIDASLNVLYVLIHIKVIP